MVRTFRREKREVGALGEKEGKGGSRKEGEREREVEWQCVFIQQHCLSVENYDYLLI